MENFYFSYWSLIGIKVLNKWKNCFKREVFCLKILVIVILVFVNFRLYFMNVLKCLVVFFFKYGMFMKNLEVFLIVEKEKFWEKRFREKMFY